MKIEYKPIGIVHSPFNDPNDTPKQPSISHGSNGFVEVYQAFQSGLSDLDGFSIVGLDDISDNRLMISGLDILDGTPILDIKPYFREFESDMLISPMPHF
jgi:tRNA (Thr-GGU) A37 N-methylase